MTRLRDSYDSETLEHATRRWYADHDEYAYEPTAGLDEARAERPSDYMPDQRDTEEAA